MDVVLLGSGNVATHLGKALYDAGHRIHQVWSRTALNASLLAESLNSEYLTDIRVLSDKADVYILSVSDDVIPQLASDFPFRDKLLVHTSGTTSLEVLRPVSTQSGVLYPLQTFSKQKPVDFRLIPIAVEGSSDTVTEVLLSLARSISDNVLVFDSAKRAALHVAAVFACNFSNHLYQIASSILQQNGLEFEILRPLIAETAAKVQEFLPREVQTGPAVRGDKEIVNKHVKFLEGQPELQELYQKLSQSIINLRDKH